MESSSRPCLGALPKIPDQQISQISTRLAYGALRLGIQEEEGERVLNCSCAPPPPISRSCGAQKGILTDCCEKLKRQRVLAQLPEDCSTERERERWIGRDRDRQEREIEKERCRRPRSCPRKAILSQRKGVWHRSRRKRKRVQAVCGEASATGVSRVVLPAQSSRRGIGKQMEGVLEGGYEQVRVVSQRLCADQPKVCATGY